jgi:hypothetical protein
MYKKTDTFTPEQLFKVSEKVAKLTRLFAEENLQVSFDEKAETACFYPAARVLQFPYNFVMISNDDIMMTFLTHEVGHAFWSTNEYIKKAHDLAVGSHANIIDDIRIERLLKNKYPGLVGTFEKGYRKLYADGFFGSPEEHAFLGFANRLNIFAKCGPITAKNIKFNEKEVDFYNRCMKAETEEEVLALAVELKNGFNAKIEIADIAEDVLKRLTDEDYVDGEVGDTSNIEDLEADEEDDDQSNHVSSNDEETEMSDEERQARIEALEKRLSELDVQFEMNNKIKGANASGATFTMYESIPRFKNEYFTYKDFIKGYFSILGYEESIKIRRNQLTKFIRSLDRSVAYMAQEFEMKKAAARYKNAKVSTSGKIDINRVFAYKYDDQIFANKMVFKDDKRHGMVIMIDASGSISRMFNSMIQQVILLTEYAKKIGVPFKVFLFGGAMIGANSVMTDAERNLYALTATNSLSYTNVQLRRTPVFFEVLSSDMSRDEYMTAATILMYGRTQFGSTPTMECMLRVEGIANDFFEQHRVTNRKLFVITDGAPTDANAYVNRYIVVDKTTDKMYRTNASATYTPISMVGKIFKDRYNIDLVSMVLTNSRRELADFIPSNSTEFVSVVSDKTFSKNRFVKTKDTMGLPIFAIKPTVAETDIDLDKVDGDMSVAKASGILSRAMSKMQVSQVLLQSLSEHFAV